MQVPAVYSVNVSRRLVERLTGFCVSNAPASYLYQTGIALHSQDGLGGQRTSTGHSTPQEFWRSTS